MKTKHRILSNQTPIIFAISLIAFFLISSCDNPSENNLSTITGLLNLVDDVSGSVYPGVDATIALYPEAEIDDRYLNIRAQYSFVGKELTQRDCFDHRNQAPIAVVETDQHGRYVFTDIPYGSYNLVVSKTGWDPKYILGLELANNNESIDPINIREVIVVDHSLDMFKTDRTYIVPQDVTLTSSNVELEGGFRLYIEPGAELVIPSLCTLVSTQNKRTIVTTKDGMYEHGLPRALSKYNQLYFSSRSAQQVIGFENLILSHAIIGLRGHAHSLNVENSFITNNVTGVVIAGNPEMGSEYGSYVSNNVFIGNDAGEGILILGPSSGIVNNNIFLGLSSGAQVKDRYSGNVSDNIFSGNAVGLTTYHLTGNVHNNLFQHNSEYDMIYYLNQGESETSSQVFKNEFYSDNGVLFSVSLDYIWLNSIMNDNNFCNSEYFYKTRIIYYDWLDPYMKFSNSGNYYLGETSPEQVELKVHHLMNEEYSSQLFSPNSISNIPNLNCGPGE